MGFLEVILMGILQGLTEFLPVSSSGHLTLFQYFSKEFHEDLSINIAVHIGTLLTILIYYRSDILQIIRGFLRRDPVAQKMVFHIFVASVPTAIIGICLKKFGATLLVNPFVAALGLLVTGFILYTAPRDSSREDWYTDGFGLTWRQALLIGFVQGAAVLPGISRSGSTIVTALWLGVPARNAARFSFLISVPAIAGAGLLEFLGAKEDLNWTAMGVGATVSFLTGLVAIAWMVNLTRKNQLKPFAFYAWFVGVSFLIYSLFLA